MKKIILMVAVLLLAGCAAFGGLEAGRATIDDVLRVLGQPAQRWQDADGSQQFAYPSGPAGTRTVMAFFTGDGKLTRIANVLQADTFAQVRPGMSKSEVTRLLGPSVAAWSSYFPARDELVWEWRYCDEWNEAAHFLVLFDASRETVRSTQSLTEAQLGLCAARTRCLCSR